MLVLRSKPVWEHAYHMLVLRSKSWKHAYYMLVLRPKASLETGILLAVPLLGRKNARNTHMLHEYKQQHRSHQQARQRERKQKPKGKKTDPNNRKNFTAVHQKQNKNQTCN